MPPTWKTTGMPASWAWAHTPNRSRWLGRERGGQPEATRSAAAPWSIASRVAATLAPGRPAGRSRRAAGGGRPSRTRACPGCGRGRRRRRGRRRACSRSCSRPLWKVLKTSWLEKPRRSRARGRSSAMNDPVAAKFLRAMISASSSARYSAEACRARSALEGGDQVALLLRRVAGLAQLVAARVAQDGEPVPVGGLGVVAQPGRRLHDVGVGVVDDPALGVGHVSLLSRLLRRSTCAASIPGRRGTPPGAPGGHLTPRQIGGAGLATLPGDGSARPPRGRGVPRRGAGVPGRRTWWASSPSWGAGVARGTRPSASRAPALGEGAGRGRLDLPGLARRARRPGGHHDRAGHLQRGVRPGRPPRAGSASWARGCSGRR